VALIETLQEQCAILEEPGIFDCRFARNYPKYALPFRQRFRQIASGENQTSHFECRPHHFSQAAGYHRLRAAFDEGTLARETGDKYLRNTVLLATVLFLAALSQRFKVFRVRLALVGVSAVLLALALYFVFTYPRA